MALMLLRVFLLGVVAAAADDVPITWWSGPRASLPCVAPLAERLQPRRPPPPLNTEDQPPAKPYVWKRGDEEISSKRVSASGALEVSRRREAEGATRRRDGEGFYQCQVRHHGGIVLGYPTHLKFASMEKQFSVHPANGTATSGQPFVLTCRISSAPPAVVSWLRDELPLPDDDRYYVLQSQLLITDVTSDDAGSYRCVATNPYLNKTRTSHAGILEVKLGDEEQEVSLLPVTDETNIMAARGSKVVLPCPVVGWPRPRMIWELTPPEEREGELDVTEEVFVIRSLQPDQEGNYTCSVEGNTHLAKTFTVTLTEPTVITIPPSSKEALRASTVRFNCTAIGRPAPTITWFKDGQPLQMAGRNNLRKSTDGQRTELVISGVTSDDAGVYQCFAQNAISVASAWAMLNVTGVDAAAPTNVQCWPVGDRKVKVTWQRPVVGEVVAYTVHGTPEEDKADSLPGHPLTKTEEIVTVDTPLIPYRFQVRAYSRLTAFIKNAASDLSKGAVCQGQGVPIRLAKLEEGGVVVSWKQFAEDNPGVLQWILQYRSENGSQEHNVTLDGSVYNYTLKASPSSPLLVRVLGSRTATWLHQDLTLVPWVSTAAAARDLDSGDLIAIPQDIEATHIGPREFTVTWRCDEADERYTYVACARSDGADQCQDSNVKSATFKGLEPGTDYEVRVQARVAHRALGGAFSAPYVLMTANETPQRFKEFSGHFVNSSTLKVSWNGAPAKYTIHYSAQLKLPVEKWASLETTSNTVLIPGIDPTETTYLMVIGYSPEEHSRIETIPPLYKDLEAKDLRYEYTRSGVRVWWQGVGPRVVSYAQNITRPIEQWLTVNVTEPSIEIEGLDPSLPTYVMVTSNRRSPARSSQVLNIAPRPPSDSNIYLVIGIVLGVCVLCVLTLTAICLWRKRKRSRSPVRSRRRNAANTEGNPEEESEMKQAVGGRAVANGGAGAGEPLLNGHVHITENPTSKTPNGKMKKGRRYEPAFDVSRYDDPDATVETVLDADASTTSYHLLDTSRKPELDLSRSSRDLSTNNSFAKLPDDNMNSELNRSSFHTDNSKIQPTLQPNG